MLFPRSRGGDEDAEGEWNGSCQGQIVLRLHLVSEYGGYGDGQRAMKWMQNQPLWVTFSGSWRRRGITNGVSYFSVLVACILNGLFWRRKCRTLLPCQRETTSFASLTTTFDEEEERLLKLGFASAYGITKLPSFTYKLQDIILLTFKISLKLFDASSQIVSFFRL